MTKKTRHTLLITLPIILVVAVVTILVFQAIYRHSSEDVSVDSTSESSEEEPVLPDISDNSNENEPPVTDEPDDDTPAEYEGSNPNASKTLEGTLTYFGKVGKEYIVNISIAQNISGSCQITLGSYTGTVAVDTEKSSACSFHIDPAKLSMGQQKLKVEIISGNRRGLVEESIDVSF